MLVPGVSFGYLQVFFRISMGEKFLSILLLFVKSVPVLPNTEPSIWWLCWLRPVVDSNDQRTDLSSDVDVSSVSGGPSQSSGNASSLISASSQTRSRSSR